MCEEGGREREKEGEIEIERESGGREGEREVKHKKCNLRYKCIPSLHILL